MKTLIKIAALAALLAPGMRTQAQIDTLLITAGPRMFSIAEPILIAAAVLVSPTVTAAAATTAPAAAATAAAATPAIPGLPQAANTDLVAPPEEAESRWIRSRAYQSQDLPAFQAGARQLLAELKREIDVVEDWAGPGAPKFMQTRLLSLRQQHEHTTQLLKAQTAATVRHRQGGPRYAFDKALSLLESTIDQTTVEVDRVQEIENPGQEGD